MEKKRFEEWFSGLGRLSASQLHLLKAALHGEAEQASSPPRRGTRYQALSVQVLWEDFNETIGTASRRLHKRGKWLTFGECLKDGMKLEASAQRCGIAVSTAFRWRHRFLGTKDAKASKLAGIVEVDETYYLESRKGQNGLERPVRRRGGTASKRGLSAEQVPLLVATDRSGTTTGTALSPVLAVADRSCAAASTALESVTANSAKYVFELVLDDERKGFWRHVDDFLTKPLTNVYAFFPYRDDRLAQHENQTEAPVEPLAS